MMKDLISVLGGSALRGLVDYLRDWGAADRRRVAEAQFKEAAARKEAADAKKTEAEVQQTIATTMKVESEAEKTKAEASKVRAETTRLELENANRFLTMVEKYGSLPESNPSRPVIGRALGVLVEHFESGTIRGITLVEEHGETGRATK